MYLDNPLSETKMQDEIRKVGRKNFSVLSPEEQLAFVIKDVEMDSPQPRRKQGKFARSPLAPLYICACCDLECPWRTWVLE